MRNQSNVDKSHLPGHNFKPLFFTNKIILAPMVRMNSLPFRLLCLKYGADLVYTEELIDYSVVNCSKVENKLLGTTDFVDDRGKVIFRTCSEEKENLIFQLGSNNPQRALEAIKLVQSVVSGIDFNFGCPKKFSLSGGMGAALLEQPELIEELLTKTVACASNPITCKIRVLPDREATLKLVRMIESCGVSAIAVHGRTKEQRPRDENQNDLLRSIAESISIPVIANGGSNFIKSYNDILEFREMTKSSSVMIARCAMKNPSIFKSENLLEPTETVVNEFLRLAVKYDNYTPKTKYALQALMASGNYGGEFVRRFHAAGDLRAICDLFDMSEWFVFHATKMSSKC